MGENLQLLRLPDVRTRTGLSRSTIYQKIADKEFPAPIPIGARAVAWDSREIDSWISKKIAQGSRG